MGMLIDGKWQDDSALRRHKDGSFKRRDAVFRNWITADGEPGPSGDGGFKAEAGRYHLYISLACPWAHRTLIVRELKKLEDAIPVSVVHWHMGDMGWSFEGGPGCTGDPLFGAKYIHEVYLQADPSCTSRASVPVLWDTARGAIVSNESSEIIRMFNSAFDDAGAGNPSLDLYPETLRDEIDAINEPIYSHVNNGVYRCGFATTQEAYEEAFDNLFATLDDLEARLARQRYLAGDRITEADWRAFTTLVRFDPVYFGHFKCNKRRLIDYPNLWNYTRELYQVPGVAETVDMFHCKQHYYGSHETINPTGIVPKGPDIDFTTPHDRGRLANAA